MKNEEDNSIEKKIGKSLKSVKTRGTSKGKKKKEKTISKLLEENQIDLKDLDIYCKSHPYNQTHIYCLLCEKFICDKCDLLEHKDHSKESFFLPTNYDSLLSNFSSFRIKLQQQQEQTIFDFENKIKDTTSNILKFFQNEEQRVDKFSQDLIDSIIMLKNQNKELITKYSQKFEDCMKDILNDFTEFKEKLTLFDNKVTQAKSRNLSFKERFEEFKKLKNDKIVLESEFKKLYSFYSFDLNCLISEFSVREFLQFLEKIKNFLEHRYMDDKTKNFKMVLEDKIKTTVFFDDTKKIYTTKNYMPKNISRVYQPIDNTNQMNCFDLSTTSFMKFILIPDKLKFGGTFHFNPFCKYINFSGRLLVCGGYDEGTKLSNKCYIIEDKLNFEQDFDERKYKNKKNEAAELGLVASSIVSRKFYQYVNKSFIFDNTVPNNTLRIIEISKLNYGRAGHCLVGFLPNIVLAISGVENLTRCEIYKLDENKWEEISSLNQARIDSSILIHNNFVYVFFGVNYNRITKKCDFLDTIERINFSCLQTSDWEFITPEMKIEERQYLPRSLCAILPTHSSSTIYIVGGQTDKDKFSNEIFQYDLEINYIYKKKECLPKQGGFIESNFIFLYKTAVLFDLYGDIFTYYQNTDTFNYCFRTNMDKEEDNNEDKSNN